MGTYVYVGFSCGANGGTTFLAGAESADALKALTALEGGDEQYAKDILRAWDIVNGWGRNGEGQDLRTDSVGSCAFAAREYFLFTEHQNFGRLHQEVSMRSTRVDAWMTLYSVNYEDEECCDKAKIKAYLCNVLQFEGQQADAILPFIERLYWG